MYHIHFSGVKGKLTRNIHLIGLFALFYFYQIRHLKSDSSKVFLIIPQNFIVILLQLIWLAPQRRPVNIKQLSTFFSFSRGKIQNAFDGFWNYFIWYFINFCKLYENNSKHLIDKTALAKAKLSPTIQQYPIWYLICQKICLDLESEGGGFFCCFFFPSRTYICITTNQTQPKYALLPGSPTWKKCYFYVALCYNTMK